MTILRSILDALIQPWTPAALDTYWPILLQGALVSVALGLIGCFLVVRGTSLLGDALSHSVLPGIVIGFLIGGSLHSSWILIGATVMGLAAAVLVQSVHANTRIKEDAALGIVFTALFALGVVMINRYAGQADLDPGCVLYGNIEMFVLQPEAVRPMAWILGAILLLLLIFYRQLLITTFDAALARSMGIPVMLMHYGLMAVLSLTVVASFEAVGAILAVALLIMPGATARLWSDRMPRMLLLAGMFGIISTVLGYWLSHRAVLDTSASAAITVAGFFLFLGSWLFAPHSGLIVHHFARRRLARLIATQHVVMAVDELTRRQQVVTEADLAGEMRLSLKRITAMIEQAVKAGWLARDNARILLTPAGQRQTRRLSRAHGLWEQYLQEQIGLPPDHVHDAADWIEHHLNESELDQLDDLLKSPQRPT